MKGTSADMAHFNKALKAYKINYIHGILPKTIVYAESYEQALKMGLAEFRRNTGTWESVDDTDQKTVVLGAELIDDNPKA